jgi:hypothetical protein
MKILKAELNREKICAEGLIATPRREVDVEVEANGERENFCVMLNEHGPGGLLLTENFDEVPMLAFDQEVDYPTGMGIYKDFNYDEIIKAAEECARVEYAKYCSLFEEETIYFANDLGFAMPNAVMRVNTVDKTLKLTVNHDCYFSKFEAREWSSPKAQGDAFDRRVAFVIRHMEQLADYEIISASGGDNVDLSLKIHKKTIRVNDYIKIPYDYDHLNIGDLRPSFYLESPE